MLRSKESFRLVTGETYQLKCMSLRLKNKNDLLEKYKKIYLNFVSETTQTYQKVLNLLKKLSR